MTGSNPLIEITRRLGGDAYSGGTRALVPGPGHSPGDRSLSLWLSGDRIVWHSFAGDTARDVFEHLGIERSEEASPREKRQAETERLQAERQRKERVWRFCQLTWAETVLLEGTPAATYLESRGLSVPLTGELRFHPRCPLNYARTSFSAAMIALVRSSGGLPVGLHVTALRADGSDKAFGDRSRLMFGTVIGAAARLLPVQADGDLALAEGVETGLSFAQLHGVPTWSALSTAGLGSFQMPLGVRRLTIAADADKAGLAAAQRLAERYPRKQIVIQAPLKGDWNDVVRPAKLERVA